MRINYKTYPILEKAKKGVLSDLSFYNEVDKKTWSEHAPVFNFFFMLGSERFLENIYHISENFRKATNKAEGRLYDLFSDIIQNDISDFSVNGTFIHRNCISFVSFITKKGTESMSKIFFMFHKDGSPICYYIDGVFREQLPKFAPYLWVTDRYGIKKEDALKYVLSSFLENIMFSMFKQYAEVETKILEPKKKVKIFGCKYLNETDMNITHLDSKWFTNLVKSDAFKVRGHFRLQPKKKEGKWTKELIWINDFEKSGYTSPARKLTQTQ